jgi:hypothetical protein
MYQAPPPIKKVLLDQIRRYAIGIGALAGLIWAHIAIFGLWPGHFVVDGLLKWAAFGLWAVPYLLIDDLARTDWIQRARIFLWLYGAIAVVTLHRLLTGPWHLRKEHWLGIALCAMLTSWLSLGSANRHIRTKP